MKKGFTLIEVLVVIGIIAVLVMLFIVNFRVFQKESDLSNTTEEILNALRLVQSKTLASEEANQYGVYFDNIASPDQYVLFKGSSYAARNSAFDEIHKLPSSVEIYEINLAGGKEVVFERLTGKALPAGNLSIRLIADPAKIKTIYIESSGLVGLSSISVPSDGRKIDSRHVHFDLGWSIQDAIVLKFKFPGPEPDQIEIVDMAPYFNADKTEFDWSGKFSIGSEEQEFKIHTHLLDPSVPPYTSFCIHRDRNNGKNNQEVIIYIVDGGIDKDIAHYLADADDAVIEGAFGGTKEIQ